MLCDPIQVPRPPGTESQNKAQTCAPTVLRLPLSQPGSTRVTVIMDAIASIVYALGGAVDDAVIAFDAVATGPLSKTAGIPLPQLKIVLSVLAAIPTALVYRFMVMGARSGTVKVSAAASSAPTGNRHGWCLL